MAELASRYPLLFPWVILPAFIFLARTSDVGLSTLRIAMIAQGRHLLAPFIGFFEALIWLFVIGQVLQYLDNPLCVIAYAAGFAMGNVFGLYLERRLAIGSQIVRTIVSGDAQSLVAALRAAGHAVTVVAGQGMSGAVEVLFTVARRREVPTIVAIVREHQPRAFLSIEDVKRAEEGFFPGRTASPFGWLRKVK